MPLIEFGGVKHKHFTRNIYAKTDAHYEEKLEGFRHECDNTDVYTTIYRYETEDPDEIDRCGLLGPFYLDFDSDIHSEEAFACLRRQVVQSMMFFKEEFDIPFPMQRLYFSGHKGFHLLIPHEVFGISYQKDLNEKYKKLMLLVDKMNCCPDLDKKIYDRRRLFRLPGSINAKGGHYKVPLTFEQLREMSLEEIQAWAEEPHKESCLMPVKVHKAAFLFDGLFKETPRDRVKKRKLEQQRKEKARQAAERQTDGSSENEEKKVYELSPCIQEMLETGTVEGRRNMTCVTLASALFQTGREFDDVSEMVQDWNTLNTPPIDDMELFTTIRSAYSMYQNGKGYGHEKIDELGYCIGTKCKKYKLCQKNRL